MQHNIQKAIDDIRQGHMVILTDDESRENEGDLVVAAEKATPEAINFMAKHARGLICFPLTEDKLSQFNLPLMVENNTAQLQTAFTVSVDAAEGITTGISARDRATCVQTMLDDNAKPEDIVTPGHMFPLKAKSGGVLSRPGHTEGSVDLAKLSGLKSAAVICEILNEEGDAARGEELEQFAKEHNLRMISINDLIAYRFQHESLVNIQASSALPTESGDEFTIKIFQSRLDNAEHIALIKGDLQQTEAPIVRIHSECLTSDILGSTRCDCGEQLKTSLEKISEEGGILLYLRQEGRGIGLANKIRAYSLQDQGMDTVEANHHLGYPADARDYGIGVQMLRKLGVNKVRMLTNNPNKIKSFSRYGLEVVERLPIEVYPKPDNIAYLTAKRDKMGHMLALLKEVG